MCDIVLLVYDQVSYTKACVESILNNTGCDYRLLIIDNGSVKKETVEYLKGVAGAHPKKIVVHRIGTNIGYVGAVNFGLGKTSSDHVCVISNDTIVYPGWLEEMIAVAQRDPALGLVNPLWTVPKKFIGGRDRYIATVVQRNSGRYIETDWARGFCFLVTRAVIGKIGGLDTAYAPGYFDDWDYSLRAIKAGFRCARALGAFVWHYKNVTYGLAFSTESMRMKGRIFYGRWGVPLRIVILHACPKPSLAAAYAGFVDQILSLQDRVTIATTMVFPALRAHTNLGLRRIGNRFLYAVYAVWLLVDNLRYAKARRYDMILCSEDMYDYVRSIAFIRNAYQGRLYVLRDDRLDALTGTITALKREKAKEYTGI